MSNTVDKVANSFLDMIKLTPKYLIGITIFTGSILMIGWNVNLSSFFGIEKELFSKVQIWVSLVFLFSLSLLLAHILHLIYSSLNKRIAAKNIEKLRQKRLHELTSVEKQILGKYIFEKTRTQSLSFINGTVRGLEIDQIIFRASSLSQRGTIFPYNIQPWAWDYLNDNKYLIEGSIDEITP